MPTIINEQTSRLAAPVCTAPQLPLVEGVLSGEHVAELVRLQDFL
jgi:hypothetical protein